jgi:hypothetical protein
MRAPSSITVLGCGRVSEGTKERPQPTYMPLTASVRGTADLPTTLASAGDSFTTALSPDMARLPCCSRFERILLVSARIPDNNKLVGTTMPW